VRLLAVVIVSLAGATLAEAAGEPNVLADAHLGSLHVTSAVYVGARSVELRGVWNDRKVSCSVRRRLRIRGEIDYIPFGRNPRRPFVRTRTFLAGNCAEGGPNVGYTVVARSIGTACPSGRWKPGRYNFLTVTTDPARTLSSTASVNWAKTARC